MPIARVRVSCNKLLALVLVLYNNTSIDIIVHQSGTKPVVTWRLKAMATTIDELELMRTLLLKFENVANRLENVANLYENHRELGKGRAVEGQNNATPLSSVLHTSSTVDSSITKTPKSVLDLDLLITKQVMALMELSNKIGSPVVEQITILVTAFRTQKEEIMLASQCIEPRTDSEVFSRFLLPLQKSLISINDMKEKHRASKMYDHLSAVSECAASLGWIAVKSTPAAFVGDMKDSAQFFANRVIKEYKDKDTNHVAWARCLLDILSCLQQYVREYHTTGLTWSAQGSDLEALLPSAFQGVDSPNTSTSRGTSGPPP